VTANKRGITNTTKYTIIQEKGSKTIYRNKTDEEEAGEIKKYT
jgi:hypothetical protein